MKEFIVVPGCLWDGVSGAAAEDRAVLVGTAWCAASAPRPNW